MYTNLWHGRDPTIRQAVNDLNGAIETYKRALSSNLTPTAMTANAHYYLAMAMMKSADMESAEEMIKQHMELALNMGFELTVRTFIDLFNLHE